MATAVSSTKEQAAPQEHVVGYEPKWYARAPLHFVVILISVLWLVPTLALLFTSLRDIQDINTSMWWTVLWKPHQFTLQNYRDVLNTAGTIGMRQAFLNSLYITIPATIFPIIVGAGAALVAG